MVVLLGGMMVGKLTMMTKSSVMTVRRKRQAVHKLVEGWYLLKHHHHSQLKMTFFFLMRSSFSLSSLILLSSIISNCSSSIIYFSSSSMNIWSLCLCAVVTALMMVFNALSFWTPAYASSVLTLFLPPPCSHHLPHFHQHRSPPLIIFIYFSGLFHIRILQLIFYHFLHIVLHIFFCKS